MVSGDNDPAWGRGPAAPSAAGKIKITVMGLTEVALVADGSC
jgi:hypothetical protein